MNPTIFLLSAARAMVPITLAAIGEIITERAGVVNIGLEGILLLSGLFSAVVSLATNSVFLGVLTGVFVGLAIGALHALISVTLRGNQIVSGVGINTFALGFVVVVLISLYGSYGQTPETPPIPRIPVAGGSISYFFIATLIIGALAWWALFRTKWGLRLRAVGENPMAADAMGINVFRIRIIATVLGAMLTGLAGAYLVLDYVGYFTKHISAGRGFIALANVVFSNWNPLIALLGGFLFGFFEALAIYLQIIYLSPSHQYVLKMIPYIATLVIVSIAMKRVRPPAALGKPYSRE